MKIGIVGGGVLGLTLALRRAQQGDQVVIFERGKEPGGLAASFSVAKGAYLEKYYHHLFGTDKDIVRLINELGLGSKLVWKPGTTANLNNGKFYRLDGPGPFGVLGFKPIPFVDRLRLGLGMVYLKLTSNYRQFENVTAAEYLPRLMGKATYNSVWKPLLQSKFGEYADKIVMSWFWSRVHERTLRLGYLRGGFNQFYVRLAEAVQQAGGEIRLNSNVGSIGPGPTVCADGEKFSFDRLVVTTPTHIFTQLAADHLPQEYTQLYANSVEHLGAHCVVLALKRSFMKTYWLNVNDPGYPFLVAVEHTNFMPGEDYGGKILMYLGNYLPVDHPLFGKSDEEILAEYVPALQRINPSFDKDWIEKMWVWKTAYAQPIMTKGYPQRLPPHKTPLEHVYLANMAHVYPQDRGQNYSIRLGEKMARMLDK